MTLNFKLLSNDSKKFKPHYKKKTIVTPEFLSDGLDQFQIESGFLESLYLNDIDGYNRVEIGYLTPDNHTIVYQVDWIM